MADFRQECVYEAFQGANKDREVDSLSSLHQLFKAAKDTTAGPAKQLLSPVKLNDGTASPTIIDVSGSVVDSQSSR